MRVLVRTRSGSQYYIEQNGEVFTLSMDNVPNPNSERVEGSWAIERPSRWPPIVGERLYMGASLLLDFDDPRRMPGGGKYTSPVTNVLVEEDPDED